MDNLRKKFKRNNLYLDISTLGESDTFVETIGIHPKFWFLVDDHKYLAKFDSYKKTSYGEIIYNSLAKQVIDENYIVEYDFVRNYEQTGVVCKRFLGEGESFLHGADFILKYTNGKQNETIADILMYFGVTNEFNHINFIKDIMGKAFEGDQVRLKENMTNFFRMFVLDCLCENIDRNLRNWGVIIDDQTGKVKRLAPIFDNGHVLGLYGSGKHYSKNYVLHYYEDHEYFGYGQTDELISIFKYEDEFYREIIKEVITTIDFNKAIKDVEQKIGGKIELHNIDRIRDDFNMNLRKIKKETIREEKN